MAQIVDSDSSERLGRELEKLRNWKSSEGVGICTMLTAAPVLPVGYVVSASRIADRRMILVGYRLAELLARVVGN
jgi:hypothetical protein